MTRTDPDRKIRAPRGSCLNCKNWLAEAAYRMIQNNLDPEVAERPESLVVYGGIGRAARNWECFDEILAPLKAVGADQTLLVSSGKPGAFSRIGPKRSDDVRSDDRGKLDLHRLARHRARNLRDVRRGWTAALRRRSGWPMDFNRRAGRNGRGAAAGRKFRWSCLAERGVPAVAHRIQNSNQVSG